MIVAILLLFAVSAFISFFEEKLGTFKWFVYAFIGLMLIILAAIRPIGIDNDSLVYEDYFFHYDNPLYEMTVEYSYRWLSSLFYVMFKDVHSVFLFYAILGVSLKLFAFRKLTSKPFLALAIYICTYYILHEFTQIRVGVSSGILLFVIILLENDQRMKALGLILIAMVFHYSSAMLLPLLFFSNEEMTEREKKFYLALIPLGYIFCFLHIELTTLPIPYIADKLESYQEMKEQGFLDEVNVFNLVYLVKIAMFFYLVSFYDIIKEHNKFLPIMVKMESISLFSFSALSSLPVLSFRVSELFGIVEIVLFANIFYTIRSCWLSKIVVLGIGFVLLSITIFYNKLIQI